MLARCTALCLSVLLCFSSAAQYFEKEKQLIKAVNSAADDSTKIIAMSKLADFYYIYRAAGKGDSVLNAQLSFAELSTNKNLLALTLFDKGVTNVANWTSSKNFDKVLNYLDKGLAYARDVNREDYQAIACLRKAFVYRKRGKYDEAMNEVLLALTSLREKEYDSLRAIIALETGDIALAKGKAVEAYRHYNQAYDIAYSMKNVRLQSETYHHYSELYNTLAEDKLAKNNILKSLELNRKENNVSGILYDYFDLARLTDKKEYVYKVRELAEKTNDERNNIRSKRLLFSWLMTVQKDCNATLNYYYQNPDLQQTYINGGSASYYWNLGNIYKYCNKTDSALYYYLKAEAEFTETYDGSVQQSVFTNIAQCYEAIGNIRTAIRYYEKSLELNRKKQLLPTVSDLTLKLSELYAQVGDYHAGYIYQSQHLLVKDSVQSLAEKSQVVLLEVDRENKKHEKDLEDAVVKASRIRNLQYMGISALIATLFIFMMLLGMFPISKLTIKMLSFFAFICLFEFIVLLIDSYLHKLTHGEPLKIWLIKIFLIAVLVPIQHFLEHGMVHFLASQRLLRMRQHLSIRRWIMKLKKPTPVIEVGPNKDAIEKIEEDTAVL